MQREVWHEKEIKKMIDTVAKTTDGKELEKFFDRILTPREINDIARRLEALRMLKDGKSYADITTSLGLSPIIIARLSNKLGYGFRKIEKHPHSPEKKQYDPLMRKRTIRYKGVPAGKI